ncbi:erbin isoform X1 [Harpia harpyja]|uniref:erbin isoform X1 n=1 Tax=Harpia harpyja TaxID=202280 RepID=UPI0022B1FF98|nr:erbin isoform X1 [Harpia harpyja]XP_052631667.1 erbin isoform X1 [Harpia harpyja]XP_052631668.1 erbin isoform X1 [Harpia harpyja]XP_052631669.1 erbin isoform X1 [Harpia harpyja]XP_052631670.1 erbin isoform X1 [Harpia harpyja]XP_052631671.1 erbin isoform X1 [Harpia harpyja]XP_052631672.1 erbin isoform X1 [Harpia harpyja]XP_052631673.1 erbin isoform X1 [Harpia harpyja]XP_052631675.1 erbin isoform X1 [Harpia harpyja]XP_052631682.1 erbin isoform X1 [Harpia harpyja]
MTTKRNLFVRLVPCRCLRGEEETVTTLDYSHCSLEQVPKEIFTFEKTLEELYLDANQIEELPKQLFNCQSLHKLSLPDNDLTTLPASIANLINLRELDVSKNGIQEFPENIKNCKVLTIVEASVNPISKLPDGFSQLLNLTQLYLNDAFLEFLPANFGRLTKLQILELRENQLKILPKTMSRLTQLERLDLGSNEFTEVPEVLEQLSGLKEFWMDGNRLTLIPGFIGTLKQLTYLDVSKNNIEVVEEGISGCESLQDLLLSSNSLQQLPESIGSLKKVTTLKIDENQLIYLPDSIGGLISVEELDCSFNEIETLPSSIGQLSNIRTFAADHNFLTQLPSEIGNWKHVTVLFLHSNKLEFLPEEMGDMQKLKVINLSDNRLKNLPFTFTKLQQLTAMWLSDNQSKPLIPLQKEADPDTQKTVLTNYMFPQQPRTEDVMFISDNESFNPSLWEEQRKQRAQVAFECDEDKDEREAPPREGNLKRYPTPYPDELKNMVKTVQTIVHRLKDEEPTEDIAKESKREGQTVSVKDVGVKTSEIASIKNRADERKQYSAGSSMQKPTEPEAEHSTANSQMTALVKTLQNTKTIVNHEDTLEQESEELSSDEEMKMAEMRPPLIETSINQPKVVALSNNKKDDSKDADSLSDEATHNSNQNNSNCSSPSRMSDSVSLNTDSSQDISLCSPDKETHAAVLCKIRQEDENLNNLLQNGGELSITVEEKINVQDKVTNLSEYELSIEERLGLIGKGVDLSTPTEESHKLDQINMNINKLVSEKAVPVPVERLQTQDIVSVQGFLNNNMKEESEHLENGNKYPINKVNGHPEEAVQSPSKDKLMKSTTVDGDSAELSVSRSTEDLSPQRSGPVMKSHSITGMDTGGLKIYDIVGENGSEQSNSVVKSASDSTDGKNIVRSKSATLLYDQPLQVFPGSSSSSDLVSSTKTVFKFDSNHNPEGANVVRGSVTSGAQMFCAPQYNIQYSSSATAKDTLWPQKQNTHIEQGSLPPSRLLRSDSTETPSYVKHSANMNFSNHNNVRASAVYNTHQRMAGRPVDTWAIPPNDRLLPGATRHTLQRQSSVSSTASVNVGDTGPSRRTQVPEGDYLTYRDLHSMGRAPPVMSGQQRPLSARTYSIDGPNVPRPQSARPSVNEIPERTMSVSDFSYSRTSPSKRSNARVNSEHSLLDPPGKSKVPHDWREQVLRHIEAKKLEKSMLSRSFNSNYAAVSSFHYGSSRDLHGSQGSVALSVADGRGSGVHIVRHPQASTPGEQCQDEVFISGQQNYSSATLSLKDVPPDSVKKIAVQIPLTNGQICQPQRPQANYSQVYHLPPQSSVARHPSREQLIDYLMLKVAHQPPYTQSQCSPRQSHELAKQEIRVRIDKDPELGFSISGGVGGRGNPFRPEDDGIFVTRVQPEGPASKLLQPGDKIIQANGYSFINIDHGQAVSLLKTFQNAVELIIVREVSS